MGRTNSYDADDDTIRQGVDLDGLGVHVGGICAIVRDIEWCYV